MTRNTIAIFLVLVIIVTAVSSAAAVATDALTKEYLTKNEWGPNIGELGLYFKFAIDNTFRTEANSEGGTYYGGTYELKDKKVVLKINKAFDNAKIIGKELTYRLVSDRNAIYFIQHLALVAGDHLGDRDIEKLWNQNVVVKNGLNRVFQNINVVTVNDLAAIKETTYYHQFPREDSKRFIFSVHDSNTMKRSDWSYTVPAEFLRQPYLDGQIKLILRTAEKDRNNRYWYCILLPIGNGGYDGLKIEGSDKYWNGSSIGWIKDTDITKIRSRY